MSKKIILFLLLVIITLGLTSILTSQDQSQTPLPTQDSPSPALKQSVTLIIDYSNGQKSTHMRQFSASESALTLLKNIASENNLPVEIKDYSFGQLVEGINNLKNSSDKAWIYFVNSRSPEVGADSYILQPGDNIEWKYLKPQ